ncbi:MAG: hypothetical protein FH758_13460 [Firmicutes bacterium]|nr:hypothetical protein [Bacillota bacterium]
MRDKLFKGIIYSSMWFVGMLVIAKLLFVSQPLGYFWIAIIALSVLFGYESIDRLKVKDSMSYQISSWLSTYIGLTYYKQQLYLAEIVNNAVKRNDTKEAEEFLEHILRAEPENETARSLIVSIWGTSLLNNNREENVSRCI